MSELTSETSFLVPILILLGAAVVFAPLFRLIGLGSVIGYLVAGMAIGPSGLGLIADPRMTLNISQLGVVLLLFLIGLALKPARLYAMRRDITLVGVSQMVFTASVIGYAARRFLGLGHFAAAAAGLALAFSATAIAMQLLEERGDEQSAYGRRSFAVLLAQDIAVAPVLALLPLLSGGDPLKKLDAQRPDRLVAGFGRPGLYPGRRALRAQPAVSPAGAGRGARNPHRSRAADRARRRGADGIGRHVHGARRLPCRHPAVGIEFPSSA